MTKMCMYDNKVGIDTGTEIVFISNVFTALMYLAKNQIQIDQVVYPEICSCCKQDITFWPDCDCAHQLCDNCAVDDTCEWADQEPVELVPGGMTYEEMIDHERQSLRW